MMPDKDVTRHSAISPFSSLHRQSTRPSVCAGILVSEREGSWLRKRTVHSSSLEQRLLDEAARLKKRAEKMPDGEARESLLRKAQQNEDAAHMNKWLTSPGLQPPKAT